ncbi:MAG: hypothetical protein LIO60_00630 [Oscillospiraceae bacterium]|nr:hypothetical protein [Oscillospiraceae bacterium]
MKKILAFMLCAALALMCAGCAGENEGEAVAVVPTGEIAAESVVVNVETDNNGYYEFWADATVYFNDDGVIEWINLEDPVLLAFQVSDDYEGGVYIYSAAEMDEILVALTEALELGETDLLQSVIDSLSTGGPIEGAST